MAEEKMAAGQMERDDELRQRALKRIEEKRGFKIHLAIYIIVNAAISATWWMGGGGYFWPMWTILGWGIGLAFHGWGAYFGDRVPTQAQIDREMQRLKGE